MYKNIDSYVMNDFLTSYQDTQNHTLRECV